MLIFVVVQSVAAIGRAGAVDCDGLHEGDGRGSDGGAAERRLPCAAEFIVIIRISGFTWRSSCLLKSGIGVWSYDS